MSLYSVNSYISSNHGMKLDLNHPIDQKISPAMVKLFKQKLEGGVKIIIAKVQRYGRPPPLVTTQW